MPSISGRSDGERGADPRREPVGQVRVERERLPQHRARQSPGLGPLGQEGAAGEDGQRDVPGRLRDEPRLPRPGDPAERHHLAGADRRAQPGELHRRGRRRPGRRTSAGAVAAPAPAYAPPGGPGTGVSRSSACRSRADSGDGSTPSSSRKPGPQTGPARPAPRPGHPPPPAPARAPAPRTRAAGRPRPRRPRTRPPSPRPRARAPHGPRSPARRRGPAAGAPGARGPSRRRCPRRAVRPRARARRRSHDAASAGRSSRSALPRLLGPGRGTR